MCPTAPWRTGPYGQGHLIVQARTHCIPCFKRHCSASDCMRAIQVDQVFEAAVQLLGGKANQNTAA